MKQQAKGFGFYFVIILLIAIIGYMIATIGQNNTEYNYTNFIEDLEEENIKKVTISQNMEVPTGYMIIELKDSKKVTLYFADVNQSLSEL